MPRTLFQGGRARKKTLAQSHRASSKEDAWLRMLVVLLPGRLWAPDD